MDDRLIARLQVIADPVQPRAEFVDQLHDTLAERLGFPVPHPHTADVQARRGRPWLLLAAAVALALALVGGALIAGAVVDRLQRGPDILDTVRSTGRIRVAVRQDHPQVIVPGGALAGFDVDVAKALGDWLDLDTELVVMSASDMVTPGAPSWDVAMPGGLRQSGSVRDFDETTPYYYWPFYVVVARSSGVSEMAELDGAIVCVVQGSTGQAWLTGAMDVPERIVLQAAPIAALERSLADDTACLADVQAGGSAALITDSFTEADLASRPDYRVLGGSPAGWEARTIISDRSHGDTTALITALDEAIAALRADGTLTSISEHRFGGQDLSWPPE